MDLMRIGWAGGVGVATAIWSGVPFVGLVGGILLNADHLTYGSAALVGRWAGTVLTTSPRTLTATPITPACPPITLPKNPIGNPPPNTTSALYQHWINPPVTIPKRTLV